MKSPTPSVRQSNFELLRLIAIFMVITHHLVIKSAQTCGYTHPYDIEQDGITGLFINSLVVGVNLFLLISGWFGIKTIGVQIIRIIFDCFIYCLITNMICVYVGGYPFSWSEVLYSCNFIHNWFVLAFVLFLMMHQWLKEHIAESTEISLPILSCCLRLSM